MIKIDRDIPIPTSNVGLVKLYPFDQLEIGDSFAVPGKQRNSARQMMHREHQKANGKRFLSRRVDGDMHRFWRIK